MIFKVLLLTFFAVNKLLILNYLLLITNIIGWVISLMYYYYVYTLGTNPTLCYYETGFIEINCAKVAQSEAARLFNLYGFEISIPLLAVIWFTLKSILAIHYVAGRLKLIDAILWLSITVTPLVPYLIYIELFEVYAICTYCTFLQIFIIITLIIAIMLKRKLRF